MKAIKLIMITAAAVVISACNKKEVGFSFLETDTTSLISSGKGETMQLEVKSSSTVYVSSDKDWLLAGVQTTGETSYSIHIRTFQNNSDAQRTASLTVTNDDYQKIIKVTQKSASLTVMTADGSTSFYAIEGRPSYIPLTIAGDEQMNAEINIEECEGAQANITVGTDNRRTLKVITSETEATVSLAVNSPAGKKVTTLEFLSLDNTFDNPWINDRTELEFPFDASEVKATSNNSCIECEVKGNALHISLNSPVTTVNNATVTLTDGKRKIDLDMMLLPDGYACIIDGALKKQLLQEYDSNADGLLHGTELNEITALDVSGCGIKNTKGIGSLRSLQTLDISDNPIKHVDLSDDLRFLREVTYDESASIDITGCRMLISLYPKEKPGEDKKGRITAFMCQIINLAPAENIVYVEDNYRSTDFSKEGEKVYVQKATKPNRFGKFTTELSFLIFGLTDKDIETGVDYEIAKQIADIIFSKEPMKSFKEYFNVYYLTRVTSQRLIDKKNDQNLSYDFEREIRIWVTKDYFRSDWQNLNYQTSDLKRWAHIVEHEITGHQLGGLCDEYTDNGENRHYTGSYRPAESAGGYENITTATKLEDLPLWWQQLASYPQYHDEVTKLKAGGFVYYTTGIYHVPVDNIMNGDSPIWGTINRFLIWRKMARDNIGNSTVEDFVEYDKINSDEWNPPMLDHTIQL